MLVHNADNSENKSKRRDARKVGAEDLSLFCYQMSIVIKSGIGISEGVEMVSEEMTDKRMILALGEITKDLEQGNTFYSCISKQEIFPIYMKAMIRIGESTGSLDDIMAYLSNYFERNAKLSQKIKSAITYPLILLALMSAIILLLVLKVLPMFNDILDNVGGDMPSATKVVLNISIGIRNYAGVILILLLVIVAGLYFYFKTSSGKRLLDQLRVKIPFIRSVNRKIYAARFSMVMSILIKSGIEHEEALDMVVEVIGNDYVGAQIASCKQKILDGSDLKSAYLETGIFSRLFAKMISIGYKTGEMENMMNKISGICENEVENSLNKATAIIEPVLVIILSLVVGAILLTVMLPLINIMSSIG